MNAVEFANVSRSYRLHRDKRNTFQERVVNVFRPRPPANLFWALRDVSFEVPRGTTLGLIGHNGSGKSTCLKLVTRILEPSSGRVAVRGRVSALLELGSGFHPDLTGRDNVFLNGSLLGLGRAEMLRRIGDIVDFAELGPFIDTPVKHYSSGMYMRLGFAIATAVDPDILITDEVLAVGDETFQRKCMDRIHAFREEGRTILFVSHGLGQVRDLCSQVVWLNDGHVAGAGDTQSVIDAYLRWANEKDRERIVQERAAPEPSTESGPTVGDAAMGDTAPPANDAHRWGSGEVQITRVEFLDERGRPQEVFQTGGRFVMRMHYAAHMPIAQPVFGIAIYHRNGLQINGPNSRFGGFEIPGIHGRGYIDYVVDELPLLAGEYLVTAAVYDQAMLHAYDHRDRQFPLTIHTDRIAERFGTILIPSRWSWHEEPAVIHSEAVVVRS